MKNRLSFLSSNPEFYSTLIKVSIPIVAQGFLSTALTFVDVLMIGQLGPTSVASVGLGNQFTLIFIMLLNGIGSGAGIFAAQYWGKRHVKHIHETFGVGLRYGLVASGIFTVATSLFSRQIIGFYSDDLLVIKTGGIYLQIVGVSYVFFSVSVVYAAVLRSTRLVVLPLIASAIALSVNTLLNYCLILGHFGFPALGVKGAGISMVVARVLECGIIVVATKCQHIPTIRDVRVQLLGKISHQGRYPSVALPVIIHSMGWVLGVAVYTKIYASISTAAIAAINISETIEKMGLMIFVGIGNACAIMVGNTIGAGRDDLARNYSRKFLFITVAGSLLMGGVVIFIKDRVLSLYRLDAETMRSVSLVLLFMGGAMWMKAANVIFNGGILRGGGDTRFSMMLDIGGVWLIGVPMGCVAAFVLHLPVYYVVLFVYTEEVVKMVIGFRRMRSNKWLKNLTKQ